MVVAIIRGISRAQGADRTLGNFWVDLTRGTLRILLPLSFLFALVLVSQGVVQNLDGSTAATLVDPAAAEVVGSAEQSIPGGPVASQIAIKELGTNGGGFFNANSAHPFENPNGFTNFLEIWSLLVIPFALVVTFGDPDRRPATGPAAAGGDGRPPGGDERLDDHRRDERQPGAHRRSASTSRSRRRRSGGNMEGKEVRFGAAACGLCAAATTGTSNGSVNCMHDSFTPLGGTAPMLQHDARRGLARRRRRRA